MTYVIAGLLLGLLVMGEAIRRAARDHTATLQAAIWAIRVEHVDERNVRRDEQDALKQVLSGCLVQLTDIAKTNATLESHEAQSAERRAKNESLGRELLRLRAEERAKR